MYEKEESDFFGLAYQDYIDSSSKLTGKNEPGISGPPNKGMFEKIEDLKFDHHQTELNKDEKKPKEKTKMKHKNSISGSSSNNLINVLQKKTNRDEGEKTKKKNKKKTKHDMDLTLKNKGKTNTEINNYEDIKKENEKKIYEMFNYEHPFIDMYPDPQASSSGDLFSMLNDDESNVEVSQKKPVYNTQVNMDIPETFNMIISSEFNN